ncbi:DUF1501 domain-containing protein [Jatrophihabitans sp. YIM 134969]
MNPPPAVDPLTRHAAEVGAALESQDQAWSKGFTRRRFIQGAGMVGVAALGTQLVTTRASFAAPTAAGADPTSLNSMVVVFLRGGCDGLRVVVPNSSTLGFDHLAQARPALLPAASTLLPLADGWAANASLAPLMSLWNSGELAFVPAVATSPLRSHTTAARYMESGGQPTLTTGYLDRLLTTLGPGTTFRAVSAGYGQPDSFQGYEEKIALDSLSAYSMPGWSTEDAAVAAESLYRGLDMPLASKVRDTVASLATAATARAQATPANGAVYPSNNSFASGLRDIAAMLKAEVGLQVATVDVGGFDTHTDEANDLDRLLLSVSQSLAAFMTDLGPQRRSRVTVVVMSEFGRRVAQNASGGSDHGFGGLMWLLGGGLTKSQVAGRWDQLSPTALDQGDVRGLNSPFDVLGEVATARLGAGSLVTMFPDLAPAPLGLLRR